MRREFSFERSNVQGGLHLFLREVRKETDVVIKDAYGNTLLVYINDGSDLGLYLGYIFYAEFMAKPSALAISASFNPYWLDPSEHETKDFPNVGFGTSAVAIKDCFGIAVSWVVSRYKEALKGFIVPEN